MERITCLLNVFACKDVAPVSKVLAKHRAIFCATPRIDDSDVAYEIKVTCDDRVWRAILNDLESCRVSFTKEVLCLRNI